MAKKTSKEKGVLPKGSLGVRDDFTEKELAGKHISRDGFVFATDKEYLDHVSPLTGFTPKDLEHQDALTDGNFSKIAAKAIERGEGQA